MSRIQRAQRRLVDQQHRTDPWLRRVDMIDAAQFDQKLFFVRPDRLEFVSGPSAGFFQKNFHARSKGLTIGVERD